MSTESVPSPTHVIHVKPGVMIVDIAGSISVPGVRRSEGRPAQEVQQDQVRGEWV